MSVQPRQALRAQAMALYQCAVGAAMPAAAVADALASDPSLLDGAKRVHVLAIGKAAAEMMRGALEQLPEDRLGTRMVVTIPGNALAMPGVTFHLASHPVPDEAGLSAAREVEDLAAGLGEGDLLLCLISGGGSALLPAPVSGVSLEDKAKVNALLLGSGADIQQMNLVRQALSRLKGGGLLRKAAPARVLSLILSDVISDDLRVVASGPTVGPIGTVAEARAVLEDLGLWSRVPDAVRTALSRGGRQPETPQADARLIGSNGQSLRAMLAAAPEGAVLVDGHLTGPVEKAARAIVTAARQSPEAPALLFGGETTVIVRGTGQGGRNQELALRVALEARRQRLPGPWVFLSGGTDGRDGPSAAAGGCVDDQTLDRLYEAGGDVLALLDESDSFRALSLSGDIIPEWATGTNVADVQVLLRPEVAAG